jgi:MinD superfamily P-loop ATPase
MLRGPWRYAGRDDSFLLDKDLSKPNAKLEYEGEGDERRELVVAQDQGFHVHLNNSKMRCNCCVLCCRYIAYAVLLVH